MVEWQVRGMSRKCGVSGEAFLPGEKVVCFIFRDDKGELIREDVREEFIDKYRVEVEQLGWWRRVVREGKEEEVEKKVGMEGVEELFLSLFEGSGGGEEREVLKQILGLMLERKRILKRVKSEGKVQTYLHVAHKECYEVSLEDYDIEMILKIKDQLDVLML